MLTIKSLNHDIEQLTNIDDFIKYINNDFFNIMLFFQSKTVNELNNEKFDLERLLYTLEDNKLISNNNHTIVNQFLILMFYAFEIIQFKSSIKTLQAYLCLTEVNCQIDANIMFLNINNIRVDYHGNFHSILTLLDKSSLNEEVTKTLLLYFLIGIKSFNKIENDTLSKSFKSLFTENKKKYKILNNNRLESIINKVTINSNFDNLFESIHKNTIPKVLNKECINQKERSFKSLRRRSKNRVSSELVSSKIIKKNKTTFFDSIHETLDVYQNSLTIINAVLQNRKEEQEVEHQIEMLRLKEELQKLNEKSNNTSSQKYIDIKIIEDKKLNEQSIDINKILLIDLDGTLVNTVHQEFKLMKDGKKEINLEKIPIFKGAKEFILYQKSINNQVIIVSDSHYRYVEKIAHEIFNVECISLCDKPNIDKIKKLIENNSQLKKKFIDKKENFIFIGDTWLDIEVGRKLNIPTVLVEFYGTNMMERRDGIGDRSKHVHMGATFYAKSFQTLNEIIKSPTKNLLALEGIFHNPIINSVKVVPIKEYYTNKHKTTIVALGRQQQGECDKYSVTQQYFYISKSDRSRNFIKSLALAVENYLKSSIEIKNYDIITFVTDKKTTQPKDKMKEIFDNIEIDIYHETLFKWGENVDGSLRDKSNRQERKEFIQSFLSVKNSININQKNIIIIDDQITTGATAEILIDQLRTKGAKNIIFIGLFTLISNVSSEKKCPKCSKNLIIKIKRDDGSKFFSCVLPKYKGNGCGYTENIKNG